MRTQDNSHKKLYKAMRVMAAMILAAAAITVDSAYRLVTTEYTLTFPNLPEGFDGLRIVQLSDLHGMSFGQDNKGLINSVSKLQPDLIVLTGDYIEGVSDLPTVETLCRELVKLAPVYFVSGNHDWGSRKILELAEVLENCGVRYLRNEYEILTLSGDSIVLAGVEDPNSLAEMTRPDELVDEINQAHPDSFRILLGHRNYWPARYPELDVDLIFSGHGHGGVVRFPFIGGILGTEHNFFPEYDVGVYESGRFRMVVSRGLGGNGILPVPRFLNNPEIVCVTLKSE